MVMIEKPDTIDILKRLADTLISDMKDHSTGEKYYLDDISHITHEELKEFDDMIGRAHIDSVSIFHNRRIRAEDGERIFCRLTLVGGTGYHICIHVEEKVVV